MPILFKLLRAVNPIDCFRVNRRYASLAFERVRNGLRATLWLFHLNAALLHVLALFFIYCIARKKWTLSLTERVGQVSLRKKISNEQMSMNTNPELFDSVSYEPLTEPVTAPCGHSFNLNTYRTLVSSYSTTGPQCPICRAPLFLFSCSQKNLLIISNQNWKIALPIESNEAK